MRTIESQMIQAVLNGRDWKSGNTTVDVTDHGIIVRLHGNKIAHINHLQNVVWVTDAGWQTTTTKSRLNALLGGLGGRAHIAQKNFVWQLTRGLDATEPYTVEMDHNQAYPVSL